ncbi:hypothetical protein [Limnobaculum parvum]|nr:hypothetical protein [Limnobaculum parvum]
MPLALLNLALGANRTLATAVVGVGDAANSGGNRRATQHHDANERRQAAL